MTTFYFKNTKTGRRFQIVKHDKETNEVTLKGSYAEFKVKLDKDWLKENGYTLEREKTPAEETEDA